MFLEDLPEPGKVECLVVLQQDQTQVKLTERQLQVVQLPRPGITTQHGYHQVVCFVFV